jgi:hypothetical protein
MQTKLAVTLPSIRQPLPASTRHAAGSREQRRAALKLDRIEALREARDAAERMPFEAHAFARDGAMVVDIVTGPKTQRLVFDTDRGWDLAREMTEALTAISGPAKPPPLLPELEELLLDARQKIQRPTSE